jgi:hypothetical protein
MINGGLVRDLMDDEIGSVNALLNPLVLLGWV